MHVQISNIYPVWISSFLYTFSVARIELVGHTGNTVFFPHSNETGEFHVNVYSTSDVVAFHITRSDGLESKAAGEILTEFLSHPYYLLMAKYRVSLPWMDNSITGLYTITISNKEGQSAMLGIRLHKLEGEEPVQDF